MTNQDAIRILEEQRNKFMDECIDYGGVNEAYNMAISMLKKQEAKEGHWIVLEFCANEGIYCSECHMKIFDRTTMPKKKMSQYCPHCGSRNNQFFRDGKVVFR